VVLRGLSHGEERGPIDWRASQRSLWESYVEPRRRNGSVVDVYYHTYESPEAKELEARYAPVRCRVTRHFSSSKSRFAAHQTSLLLALETLVPPKEVYDEIFVARFDLLFKSKVTDWRVKDGAFNVAFRDVDRRKHCDVLWLFPGSALPEIVEDLKKILHKPPHRNCCGGELHFYHPKSLALNYMVDGHFSSDTDWPDKFPYNVNPIYVLHRVRGFRPRPGPRPPPAKKKERAISE